MISLSYESAKVRGRFLYFIVFAYLCTHNISNFIMNRLASVLTIMLLLALMGCSKKKESNIIIAKTEKATPPQAPVATGNRRLSNEVEWVGNRYKIETALEADSSLALASDGSRRYYDNCVKVSIIRADGSHFFDKSFTKTDFKSCVEPSFFKDGALLAVVFLNAEGKQLRFVATVGNPDSSSDESQSVLMKIDNFGNVRIEKGDVLDNMGEEFADEELMD